MGVVMVTRAFFKFRSSIHFTLVTVEARHLKFGEQIGIDEY